MKANYKNLHKIGYIEKYLSLMEFGDEIGFFRREGNQRVQNMGFTLTTEEFKKKYQEYLDNPILNLKNGILVEDEHGNIYEVFLLKASEKWNGKKILYLYADGEIYQRVYKRIKSRKNIEIFTIFGVNLTISDSGNLIVIYT